MKGRTLVKLLSAALLVLAVAAPANAARPNAGNWFSEPADADDETNLSSIQFKVADNRKQIRKLTIFWRCGDRRGYHKFRNLPFPIGINERKKFKLVGATEPPEGQSTKDFTLRGEFISRKRANYSMELEGCGPKTKGKLKFAEG
jgi:hypothetical protein